MPSLDLICLANSSKLGSRCLAGLREAFGHEVVAVQCGPSRIKSTASCGMTNTTSPTSPSRTCSM